MGLFAVKNKTQSEKLISDDKKYSHGFGIPTYTPKNVKPKLNELFDESKYRKLCAEINKANISDSEKEFLRLAASRHIVFNYGLIADYYAHSNKVVQKLMENSALVIVDVDDAILNGYVQLSGRMEELRNEAKEQSK